MKVYTKIHLLERLKKANDDSVKKGGPSIPFSYKSLIKYERLGIIPNDSKAEAPGLRSSMRFYTEDEIEAIVAKVKEYKANGKI